MNTEKTFEAFEINRNINFPSLREIILLNNVEVELGDKFATIMSKLYEMPDSFGLCGVIAGHALGLLKNRSNWLDVDYDPIELKNNFDNKMRTGEGKDAFTIFREQFYKGKFYNKAVVSKEELIQIYQDLSENEGLLISVLCTYPNHKGTHTHWLASMDTGSEVLLVGDLSPFGLKSVGITVSYASLASAMSKVIGVSPTSSLSKSVAESTTEGGRDTMMKENVFTSNGSIWNEL